MKRRQPKVKHDPEVLGHCKVCKGGIVARYENHVTQHGPMLYGPGSRNQFSSRQVQVGFECKKCGLLYGDIKRDNATPEYRKRMDREQAERKERLASSLNAALKRWDVGLHPDVAWDWFQYVLGERQRPLARPVPLVPSEGTTESALDDQHVVEDVAELFQGWGLIWRKIDPGASARLLLMLTSISSHAGKHFRPVKMLTNNEWLNTMIESRATSHC